MSNLIALTNQIAKRVESLAIIQTPDWDGGFDQRVYFDYDPNHDWYGDLGDFSYVEWTGRPVDLLKDMPVLACHKEPFHEEPLDYEWDWWEDEGLLRILQ